jgi:arginine decarboxylase
MIPTKYFTTNGVGVHKDRLASFEMALRDAGIEFCNLVYVSSILPPGAKRIPKNKGIQLLSPGEITFVVMARSETNEPNRLISASVGMAVPAVKGVHGYLSEHHSFGETGKKSGEYAEDLAATMLATTLGIQFNPSTAWDDRKKLYKASGLIINTTNTTQSAEGNKDGLWTTAIAAVVLLE